MVCSQVELTIEIEHSKPLWVLGMSDHRKCDTSLELWNMREQIP